MNAPTAGMVASINNHGSLVQLVLDDRSSVFLDWRMFQNLYQAEGGDVLGRHITFDGSVLRFDDDREQERERDTARRIDERAEVRSRGGFEPWEANDGQYAGEPS